MTKITTTSQKKNTTIPGIAYPATDLALATCASYPAKADLFGGKRRLRLPGALPVAPRPLASTIAASEPALSFRVTT
jgi:hypothetical protein